MSKGGLTPFVEVNQPPTTVVIDCAKLIANRGALSTTPPIDRYYARTKELIRLSSEPWCKAELLGLLAVDLVGSVELYVRSILVGLAAVCPMAKQLCDRKQISIAAVTYYAGAELVFAVLDHVALSDSKAIANATQNLVGLQARTSSSLDAALEAFDRVCHLRHAITHQNGRLGPNNLLELGLQPAQPSIVALDAIRFQELVAICHTLVRALNQFLFEKTIERWAAGGLFSSDWKNDEQQFRALCDLLASKEDFPNFDIVTAYQRLGGLIAAQKSTKQKTPP